MCNSYEENDPDDVHVVHYDHWSRVFIVFILFIFHVFIVFYSHSTAKLGCFHFVSGIWRFSSTMEGIEIKRKEKQAIRCHDEWVVITHNARHDPKWRKKPTLKIPWRVGRYYKWCPSWAQETNLQKMTGRPSYGITPVIYLVSWFISTFSFCFSFFLRDSPTILHDFLGFWSAKMCINRVVTQRKVIQALFY